jgi:alpha-1,3-rhamnosyl/mannosyltransferase
VICVSRATARDVVGLLDVPHRKIRVIPNAIEQIFSQPPGPPPLEPPYLLCVGTPEPRKNLPALLEAFDQVRRAGRRVRLALVGADGWGDVRVGSTEGVVAFGRVDDAELRDLYAHAEALVLPSLWEGFGLPVGEALAAGTRVACSDLPALREVAGEDATYFDPSDPAAIADGILRSLAAPRRQLG